VLNLGDGERILNEPASLPPPIQPRLNALVLALLACCLAPALAGRLANGMLTANDAASSQTGGGTATATASAARTAASPSTAGLTMGPDGAPRFLFGYNLGNVRFIPFAKAPLSQSAAQLKALLTHAFDDMAETGKERRGMCMRRRRARALLFAVRLPRLLPPRGHPTHRPDTPKSLSLDPDADPAKGWQKLSTVPSEGGAGAKRAHLSLRQTDDNRARERRGPHPLSPPHPPLPFTLGCNAVRFWLHIDGSTSPEWDAATGLVTGISTETVDDLKWVLKVRGIGCRGREGGARGGAEGGAHASLPCGRGGQRAWLPWAAGGAGHGLPRGCTLSTDLGARAQAW